jgi:hypothetical protein
MAGSSGWHSEYLHAQAGLKVVCWDLDSTVRCTMQRRHLIPEIRAGRADWHDYSLLCADDEPVEGAVAVMRLLASGHLNIAVSGTSERALDLTRDWCQRHRVPLDDFILRPGDTPNGEFKVAAVRRLQEAGMDVVLFVEDWKPAARHIREQTGVPVLGVNPFDPGSELVTRDQLAIELEKELSTDPESAAKLAGSLFARLGGAF